MKYKEQGNCPYCDSERGIITPWAMGPEGMRMLQEEHNNHHPQNQPKQKIGVKCPSCGKEF